MSTPKHMFIGHFAVALASKRLAPKANLGLSFIACQFLDLLWPVLVIAGLESVKVQPGATEFTPFDFHYPYSHSLIMAIVWSLVFAALVWLFRRNQKIALVMGALVFSHWILDFISHRPDLPLLMFDGGPKVGLGLWYSRVATVVVEGSLFAAAVYIYVRTVRVTWWFWSLIGFLVLMYAANIFAPVPPEDTTAIMIAGPALAMWLLALWAWAADRR